MKKIIFVVDEPRILQGLQRMLHGQRNEWEMLFAEGGDEALKLLSANSDIDIIITDMRMPKMSGADLLNEVIKINPKIVRMVLSGFSDKEMIYRSVQIAHQYLCKPVEAEVLISTIQRIFNLRELFQNNSMKSVISEIDSLPALPTLYIKLMDEMQSEDSSMQRIGDIISHDLGMSAKILHVVNSAFFGFPRHVSNPSQAVTLLGLETLKALIMSIHIFSEFTAVESSNFSLDLLRRHSFLVAGCARAIAMEEKFDKHFVDYSYIAGLLHDSGILLLASRLKEKYASILTKLDVEKIDLWKLEQKEFQTSHAEVGAYLMGLWGLQDPILEAIAYHHQPRNCFNNQFSVLAAVYVANVLATEFSGFEIKGSLNTLDMDYISSLGLLHKLDTWKKLCKNICEGAN